MKQKRSHFRIVYPDAERPRFKCFGKDHMVLDLSEKGIKIYWSIQSTPAVSQQLQGTIQLGVRGTVAIDGEVIRVGDRVVVIKLTKGIPLEKIISEQRYLINKYGTLKQN